MQEDFDMFCERCSEKLKKDRIVWLELRQITNTYHKPGTVEENLSLGEFPFGSTCAIKLIQESNKINKAGA